MACCCQSLWAQAFYGMLGQESQMELKRQWGKTVVIRHWLFSPSQDGSESLLHAFCLGNQNKPLTWLNLHLCERHLSSSVLPIQAKLIYLVFIVSNNKWNLLVLCISVSGLAEAKPKPMHMLIFHIGRYTVLICTHIISLTSFAVYIALYNLNLMQKMQTTLELFKEHADGKDILFLIWVMTIYGPCVSNLFLAKCFMCRPCWVSAIIYNPLK